MPPIVHPVDVVEIEKTPQLFLGERSVIGLNAVLEFCNPPAGVIAAGIGDEKVVGHGNKSMKEELRIRKEETTLNPASVESPLSAVSSAKSGAKINGLELNPVLLAKLLQRGIHLRHKRIAPVLLVAERRADEHANDGAETGGGGVVEWLVMLSFFAGKPESSR